MPKNFTESKKRTGKSSTAASITSSITGTVPQSVTSISPKLQRQSSRPCTPTKSSVCRPHHDPNYLFPFIKNKQLESNQHCFFFIIQKFGPVGSQVVCNMHSWAPFWNDFCEFSFLDSFYMLQHFCCDDFSSGSFEVRSITSDVDSGTVFLPSCCFFTLA